MSYKTHESLEEIVGVFKAQLPALKEMLQESGEPVPLHPVVEMMSSLVARYERGEIVEAEGRDEEE